MATAKKKAPAKKKVAKKKAPAKKKAAKKKAAPKKKKQPFYLPPFVRQGDNYR